VALRHFNPVDQLESIENLHAGRAEELGHRCGLLSAADDPKGGREAAHVDHLRGQALATTGAPYWLAELFWGVLLQVVPERGLLPRHRWGRMHQRYPFEFQRTRRSG
jgi:hypothetical protein